MAMMGQHRITVIDIPVQKRRKREEENESTVPGDFEPAPSGFQRPRIHRFSVIVTLPTDFAVLP
jgi:hypothetical protein